MGDVVWTDEAREAVARAILDGCIAVGSLTASDIALEALAALTPHVEAMVREARAEGHAAGLRKHAWRVGSLVLTPGDLEALIESARSDARKEVRRGE